MCKLYFSEVIKKTENLIPVIKSIYILKTKRKKHYWTVCGQLFQVTKAGIQGHINYNSHLLGHLKLRQRGNGEWERVKTLTLSFLWYEYHIICNAVINGKINVKLKLASISYFLLRDIILWAKRTMLLQNTKTCSQPNLILDP